MTTAAISKGRARDGRCRQRYPSQYPRLPRPPPSRLSQRSPPTQARPKPAVQRDASASTRSRNDSSILGEKKRESQFFGRGLGPVVVITSEAPGLLRRVMR